MAHFSPQSDGLRLQAATGLVSPDYNWARAIMGLYFEILAVESDLIHERRGRIQRIVGIHPRWFRHPDAIRVPMGMFDEFKHAFQAAHSNFNYYGPTEYKGEEIAQLCHLLRTRPCKLPARKSADDVAAVAARVLSVSESALANRLSLLVLGI
jgi:hypothetical protein